MTADLARVLDQLDQAHAAATPGPWRTGGSGIVAGLEYVVLGVRTDPDAAAIVLEHNLTPALVAAVRAVAGLADQFDTLGRTLHNVPAADAYDDAAQSIRAALNSALLKEEQ